MGVSDELCRISIDSLFINYYHWGCVWFGWFCVRSSDCKQLFLSVRASDAARPPPSIVMYLNNLQAKQIKQGLA